jgi:phenylacetate-coenzyme A ligase PaaK-like adenylate-forming protein
MIRRAIRSADRLLRSSAYDVLSKRDRLDNWQQGRDQFLASARLSAEALAAQARERLGAMLEHAFTTSPYYRETWKGMELSRERLLEDFESLPFLTKDILRAHKTRLASEAFPVAALETDYTGGTTGTQTSFLRNRECTVARVGRQWGALELCGYRPGMPRALIWGAHVDLPPPGIQSGLKQRFRKFATNQEILPCTVLTQQSMLDYHARLRDFRPEVLYGYPNAMVEIGKFIVERGLAPVHAKTIISTAERLTDAQRSFLESAFGGEVFNLYCTREYGCVAFECTEHDGLHIDTGSVFVEITRDGLRVGADEPGEITVTDLMNRGMPFIRSRTGDLGTLSSRPCRCGLPFPLLKSLDGRAADLLYRPDGSRVAGLMLTDLFMDMPAVRFAQFIQETPAELDVNIVVTEAFGADMEREIVRQVREIVGDEMNVRVHRVADIPRNPRSGKFQEVICRVGQRQSP